MTPQTFELRPIDYTRLPPLLRAEAVAPSALAYEVVQYDANGYEISGERGRVLWLPDACRGGVSFGGDAVWTDADSAEDAVRRVLADEIIA